MSTTTTTAAMVAKLQQRIPMGLANAYCMDQLNQAFRWIEQQGAFTWNLAFSDVIVRAGTFFVAPADMPPRFDAGKPTTIYGVPHFLTGQGAPIPYVAPETISQHQTFHVFGFSGSMAGVFSVFTIVTNLGTGQGGTVAWPTEVPYILFAPSLSIPPVDTTYHIVYHQIPLVALAEGVGFYPTPDPFDDLIVDLAEGEIKRIYNLTMWEAAIQKAQNSTLLLLDKYRSPRQELAGLTEQAKETQESQLKKAQ